jgi:CRP-like cAMP-binding protein
MWKHQPLQTKQLQDLVKTGRLYKLQKGQINQSTEDRPVFNMIVSGYIKRYLISNDGGLGVQVVYGPGDMFPITLAYKMLYDQDLNEGPEVYYYEAMTDVQLYTVQDSVLSDAVKNNPSLYRDLMAVAGKRLGSTLNGLENLTLRSSYRRIAHQLLYLGEQYGKKTDAGTEVMMPLTHQDLADILSLTRETISTGIIKLRKKGLIKTGKAICIPDMEKLKEEAYNG